MTEIACIADPEAAYVRAFRARVEARPPGALVLDRTFFFPAGGGQPSDRGILRNSEGGEWAITEVQHRGEAVIHRVTELRRPPRLVAVGDELEGSIDWELRYRHMRAHTAQHLTSSLIFSRTGTRTRRATIGAESSSIELEHPLADSGTWDAIRGSTADRVREDLTVGIRFVPRDEYEATPAARSGLAPLPRSVTRVRLIAIEGIDTVPCGGTHVRRTGEIGSIEFTPVPTTGPIDRVSFRLKEPGSGAPPS
ncbi:MAG: alanyl-tRNA editing protein [Thermoplasmata archaeon]|nr:alanyl-tRNA editing protein [Thermoplasmata archaeon]